MLLAVVNAWGHPFCISVRLQITQEHGVQGFLVCDFNGCGVPPNTKVHCSSLTFVHGLPLQMVTRGPHEFVLDHVVKGVPPMAVGTVGQIRSLENFLDKRDFSADSFKNRIYLHTPAAVLPGAA